MPEQTDQAAEFTIEFAGTRETPQLDGSTLVELRTNDAPVLCRYYPADTGDAAVLWAFGAGGGWNGPAGGLYPRLGKKLAGQGAASLEVGYRHPGQLEPCILDALIALMWLKSQGRSRVALVGHSFGGAVAINAAAVSPEAVAVAGLSSQSHGGSAIAHLGGKPVLLVHGEADEVLPDRCSRSLYRIASEPKTLLLYPDCRHGLDECRDALDQDLLAWLREVLFAEPPRV